MIFIFFHPFADSLCKTSSGTFFFHRPLYPTIRNDTSENLLCLLFLEDDIIRSLDRQIRSNSNRTPRDPPFFINRVHLRSEGSAL